MVEFSKELKLRTEGHTQFLDVTSKVREIVRESGVKEGRVVVFAPHATAAVIVNENEPGLLSDFEAMLERLVPRKGNYGHDKADPGESNSHSHQRALLLGPGKEIPVTGGEPALGTWQAVFFVELDGPRDRRLMVQVSGGK